MNKRRGHRRTRHAERATLMKEEKAKKQLDGILRSFTAGSVLALLAELFKESAEEAGRENDAIAHEQRKLAEHTLIVVGLGIDAICPR